MPSRHWLVAGVIFLSGLMELGLSAQETDCVGELRLQIRGTLNVVGNCRLEGTLVLGKVRLFEGGSLTARGAQIFGSIEGKRANFVDIDRTLVVGNVQLEEFVGDESTLQRTNVTGNVELRNNRSHLEILNNDINRNLQITGNSGGVLVSGNSVERDLRCENNDPEPLGLGNRVDGETREQCDDLQAEPPPSTPPPVSQPPPTPPPATTPPPAVTPPPATTPPPVVTPPPVATPPTVATPPPAPPPTASDPPVSTPPPAAPATAAAPELIDDGGAGAFGWSVLFLLPLLAARRRRAYHV